MLVERGRELDAIASGLDEALAGNGSTVVVTGPAGIGKSSLLEAAGAIATQRGLRVLAASGGELEQELPFAIVRHLFQPALRALPDDIRSDVLSGAAALAGPLFGDAVTEETSVSSLVHGLYWVCSNLCEIGPLLIAADDLHWADEASVRFLAHLVRRVADLPIVLALGLRPVPAEHDLSRALAGAVVTRLPLAPLTSAGVGDVVRAAYAGQPAAEAFCVACANATGGNPFLLAETLRALRERQVAPTAGHADAVENLPVDAISHSVRARLHRLGAEAVALAQAVALLGPQVELRLAAALAGLPVAEAAALIEKMAAESLTAPDRPIRFVHPLIRTAVYLGLGDYARAAGHKRAARLLDDDGLPAPALLPHLIAADPEADPWVVDRLRAAAAAVGHSAPEVAAACLERALAEPPPPTLRLAVTLEWGRALGKANRPDEAAAALRTVIDQMTDVERRADIAVELGALMIQTGRGAEAVAALDLARTAADPADEHLARASALYALALSAMEPPAVWVSRLDRLVNAGETDRMVLANLACAATASGARSAAECAELARRSAEGALPVAQGWQLVNFAGVSLSIADRFPEALAVMDRGFDAARARGDAAWFRFLSIVRSHAYCMAGRLADAEADARTALTLSQDDSPQHLALAAAVLIDALVEQGRLDEAEQLLASAGLEGDIVMIMVIAHFVPLARGRLRVRQHRPAEALRDLLPCGETLIAAGCGNPGFAPWRAEAAMAHWQLGDHEAARALALEDLRLARAFGAARPIGLALHTLGLVEGRDGGLTHLAEAVQVHRSSTAELELGRALVDLGAALRRHGQRTHSVAPLREGLDIATRCGATGLADRATAELVAAGSRPRRGQLRGPDALTASELRVARLAARAVNNREIAQALFVSLRTVESHLTKAYRKLGIDSRQGLAEALGKALGG